MKWALVEFDGTVTNVIEYDGLSPYKPQRGVMLKQVADEVQIGDNILTEENEL